MPINIKLYFERISYKGTTDVSVETLRKIHATQVFAIPFENLAIHEEVNVNNPKDFIALDAESLFKKLVIDKRGGYCHENNELLALVLIELGFKVTRLAARVLTAPNLPKSHKLLMVTIDNQQWLADVGFGGYGLFEPIPLVPNQAVKQHGDCFKLVYDKEKYVLQILNGTVWKSLYSFDREPVSAADYVQMNYFVSHHPDSIFVKNRVCVMPRPEGRVILNNYQLKVITNKKEKTIVIKDETEYFAALAIYFGIKLEKNVKLKAIKIEKPPEVAQSKHNTWCNFFVGTLVVLGVIGAIGFANRDNLSNRGNKL